MELALTCCATTCSVYIYVRREAMESLKISDGAKLTT